MITQILKKPIIEDWSAYSLLSFEDKQVFNSATANGELLGVDYIAQEVAIKTSTGTNYRFKCDAFLVSTEKTQWEAIIEIFKPLTGRPYITGITKL